MYFSIMHVYLLQLFKIILIYLMGGGLWTMHGVCVEVRGQIVWIGLLFPPFLSWGWKSGLQTWQQANSLSLLTAPMPTCLVAFWFFVQYGLLCCWYHLSFFLKKKISFSVLFSSRISDSFFKLLQSLFSFYGRILNCFSVFSWSSLWFLKTTMLNSLLGVGVSVLVVIALHFVDWAKLLFPENSCWLEHIVICGWRTITDCFIWTFSSRSHPSQGLGCCQYFSTRGHLKSKTVPPI